MRASFRSASSQAGISLVELVVSLLLGAMVFLGLGYVYALNQGLWIRGQAKLALHTNGTRALEEIGLAAGHAGAFAIPEDGELALSFPVSPLGHDGPLHMNFQLRENVLTRNGEPLVPSRGDTSIGVAVFTAERMPLDENGVGVLSVRLKLYTRSALGHPPDTMTFETSIHARNLGLGLGRGPTRSAAANPGSASEGSYF